VLYAVVMTCIYPIGITALYAVLLWKQRQLVCPEKREWQKICGIKIYPPLSLSIAEDTALLAAREAMLREKSAEHAMLCTTQFLFKEYEPRFWWFEVFECTRRLMLTGGTVFFLEGSATQVAAGMLVSLASIQVYARTQPYICDQDDVLAMSAQWGIYFTLFVGLLLKTNVPRDDGYNNALGGLLVFVNLMVILLAICTFAYLVFLRSSDGDTSLAQAQQAPATSANPAPRKESSSIGTTINPMVPVVSDNKPLAAAKSGSKKRNTKLTSRARDIYAATNPATQGSSGNVQKPTAQL